ncbi:cell division protein FtsX, partial [endosymbiont of Lamellibrachia barhami]|uniref:cell division protein FtsX n=1 Tax=endosymbiont of Lamellibrachia barhami TaxID=205975 RepID=UPI001C4B3309
MSKRRNNPMQRHPGFRPNIWLQRHLQVALASLGRLTHAPLGTLMTAAVIGIALALPIGLHVMLNNLQNVSGGWESGASISLFLKQEISDKQAVALSKKLRLHQRIESVQVISKASAMAEFRRLSGFGDALEALDSNPLPA